MALYVDFTVETEDRAVADKICERLSGTPLCVSDTIVKTIEMDIFQRSTDGIWFLRADPGYSNGWHGFYPELNCSAGFASIREEFYKVLLGISGFRRALFGYEACDFLANCPEDFFHFDVPELIVRQDLVHATPLLSRCSPFSEGYLRVRKGEAPDLFQNEPKA